MSASYPSDRPEDRVDAQSLLPTEFAGLQRRSAPESITSRPARTPVPERRPGRTSAARLERLAGRLTDRDRRVIRDIDRFGFLTTQQLQRLHFSDVISHTAAAGRTYRALTRLTHAGVIEPLERRIGGVRAGSASFVWRLGPVGARLLAESSEVRTRRKEPSQRFLDHRLAVAAVAVDLTRAAREQRFELIELTTEPDTWRSFLSSGAVREILKPDLFAVTASGEYEDYWFLEIDRATESLPTVIRQCEQYARYRRTGDAITRHGVHPLVVWLVPSEARRLAISGAITSSRLDAAQFRVIVQADIVDLVAGGAA